MQGDSPLSGNINDVERKEKLHRQTCTSSALTQRYRISTTYVYIVHEQKSYVAAYKQIDLNIWIFVRLVVSLQKLYASLFPPAGVNNVFAFSGPGKLCFFLHALIVFYEQASSRTS